jgi:DNA-binding beta-propeller fold protein YncE
MKPELIIPPTKHIPTLTTLVKGTAKQWCRCALAFVIALGLAAVSVSAQAQTFTFFVINSPSSSSQGADSILTFDSRGNSSVFFSATHNFQGLDDIACSFNDPKRIVVSHYDFSEGISELLEFNASGGIVRRTPFGTRIAGAGPLAFDHADNFYAIQGTTIFKNGVPFANIPDDSASGKLAADNSGNLYATKPISSNVYRIDPRGNVTLFANAAQGVDSPEGLAVGPLDDIYVAQNPPSAQAFILKFDQAGAASPFAINITFQPELWGMAFGFDGDLYATNQADNAILKFDSEGNFSLFADASKGLNLPSAITRCPPSDAERF